MHVYHSTDANETMTASQAAQPSTGNHQEAVAADHLDPWHHHGPSGSSTSASDDRLTPDSDSDDDPGALLHDGEVYELKDRTRDPDSEHEGDHVPTTRRPLSNTPASLHLYTSDEESSVISKFDRRLTTFLALCYMLSFLDRSNIGNAYIAGMDTDLQSYPYRPGMYEWALTAFYISYIGFEWMSLLWRVIPAHIFVSVIVLSWGVIASLQAVAVNYPMLILLRGLLGVGEAAFTGVPVYLSYFYRREELAFRTAMFVSAAPLATCFASSLGWVILRLGEGGPIASWRLLFLVEGFPSVLVAVVAWRVVPDSPETAGYLSARERRVARLRLRGEKPVKSERQEKTASETARVLSVLTDPSAWLTGFIFFLANMAYSSLPVFLPTILTQMGHSAVSAQALAAPPYLASFFIVLATAHISDRQRSRSPLLITAALTSAAGYAVLALSTTLHLHPASLVRYLAVYPAAAGFFTVVVLTIAWSVNNQADESRRGGGFALLQVLGQCGPLVGARLYPGRDAPFYTPGMSVCACAMLGVAVLATGLRWYLARLNRRLDEEEGVEVEMDGEEEMGLVGGRGRGRGGFRYML